MDSSTGGPMVILGTKRPSMTSTWSWSAPPASTRATASPSAAKSAERMLGAIFIPSRPYCIRPPAANRVPSWCPPESDRGEAVGAVHVREEAHEALGVELHGEALGRIRLPLR